MGPVTTRPGTTDTQAGRDVSPVAAAHEQLAALDQPAVISLVPDTGSAPVDGPLAGLTVAVKDNIDVAGVPTTAGDPRRTTPAAAHAGAVQALVEAGAVPVAKTNLDQYATGLVGTRSPYGACHSVLSPEHVSGGSSSGSAVAVASGAVDVALGTDTAGSGRVPAAFNGIVGWKPTKGLVSARGVVPACPSLDCVTTLTRDVATARRLAGVLARFDPQDPWSRRAPQVPPTGVARTMSVVAVPSTPLDLDDPSRVAWAQALDHLRTVADEVVEVDVTPLLEAARLLYDGPWVAERWEAFGDAVAQDDPAVDPTVAAIVRGGERVSGRDTFAGMRRLQALAAQAREVMARADALLLPVAPTHPTLAEVAADPVGPNSRLGTYTNMVNLLDLCAVAVPGPARPDGLPFGVQLLAPAFADLPLLELAARWTGEDVPGPLVPAPGRALLCVVGAHLAGEPLNHQLTDRGGRLVRRVRTAGDYRMHVLPGPVARPALVPDPGRRGAGYEAELWELPTQGLGELLPLVAPPLGLGGVRLADGSVVTGFTFTGTGADLGTDIGHLSGWREHVHGR